MLHASAEITRKEVGTLILDAYFKFAFVRNPWDWQVSMYHFILKEPGHTHHQRVRQLANFSDYVQWMLDEEKSFARGATRLQKDMICNDQGEVIVDFVGRFENLSDDFAYICRYVNIEGTIPFLNKSTHKDYKSYYDQDTYDLIAEYAKEDIALFGYSFESYTNSANYLQRRISSHEIYC